MTRLALIAAVASCLATPFPLLAANSGANRPNVLFVYTDDHATQAISAYASRLNVTPNIDRLALEGMRFDRCYVTNSICGPCRACVLTGKYSHKNGFFVNENTVFDGSQQTLPKLLQQAGYQTSLFGKWHLGSEPTGFDDWEVLVGQGTYYNPEMIRNGTPTQHTGYATEIITDLTIDWLRSQRNPEKPFFLMYQHKAPHRPWDPGPQYLTLYDDHPIPEPPGLFEDYATRGLAVRSQDMTIAETLNERDLKLTEPENLTPEQLVRWRAAYGPKNKQLMAKALKGEDLVRWKYQRYIKDYLRCVRSVDDQLGRVLDYLDQEGLTENTIVIYCSDQGFFLGEHGWFDKRWIYEESLRTPLLVRWPGVVKPGTRSSEIVSPIDFAPTLLEAAGAPLPQDLQGHSFVPLLCGETPEDWRECLYYHYYEYPGWHYVRRHYGVVDGRFKLIHFYEEDVNEWEMYDLLLDRDELVNVINNPVFAEDKRRLKEQLAGLRKRLEVPAVDPPASVTSQRPERLRRVSIDSGNQE